MSFSLTSPQTKTPGTPDRNLSKSISKGGSTHATPLLKTADGIADELVPFFISPYRSPDKIQDAIRQKNITFALFKKHFIELQKNFNEDNLQYEGNKSFYLFLNNIFTYYVDSTPMRIKDIIIPKILTEFSDFIKTDISGKKSFFELIDIANESLKSDSSIAKSPLFYSPNRITPQTKENSSSKKSPFLLHSPKLFNKTFNETQNDIIQTASKENVLLTISYRAKDKLKDELNHQKTIFKSLTKLLESYSSQDQDNLVTFLLLLDCFLNNLNIKPIQEHISCEIDSSIFNLFNNYLRQNLFKDKPDFSLRQFINENKTNLLNQQQKDTASESIERLSYRSNLEQSQHGSKSGQLSDSESISSKSPSKSSSVASNLSELSKESDTGLDPHPFTEGLKSPADTRSCNSSAKNSVGGSIVRRMIDDVESHSPKKSYEEIQDEEIARQIQETEKKNQYEANTLANRSNLSVDFVQAKSDQDYEDSANKASLRFPSSSLERRQRPILAAGGGSSAFEFLFRSSNSKNNDIASSQQDLGLNGSLSSNPDISVHDEKDVLDTHSDTLSSENAEISSQNTESLSEYSTIEDHRYHENDDNSIQIFEDCSLSESESESESDSDKATYFFELPYHMKNHTDSSSTVLAAGGDSHKSDSKNQGQVDDLAYRVTQEMSVENQPLDLRLFLSEKRQPKPTLNTVAAAGGNRPQSSNSSTQVTLYATTQDQAVIDSSLQVPNSSSDDKEVIRKKPSSATPLNFNTQVTMNNFWNIHFSHQPLRLTSTCSLIKSPQLSLNRNNSYLMILGKLYYDLKNHRIDKLQPATLGQGNENFQETQIVVYNPNQSSQQDQKLSLEVEKLLNNPKEETTSSQNHITQLSNNYLKNALFLLTAIFACFGCAKYLSGSKENSVSSNKLLLPSFLNKDTSDSKKQSFLYAQFSDTFLKKEESFSVVEFSNPFTYSKELTPFSDQNSENNNHETGSSLFSINWDLPKINIELNFINLESSNNYKRFSYYDYLNKIIKKQMHQLFRGSLTTATQPKALPYLGMIDSTQSQTEEPSKEIEKVLHQPTNTDQTNSGSSKTNYIDIFYSLTLGSLGLFAMYAGMPLPRHPGMGEFY